MCCHLHVADGSKIRSDELATVLCICKSHQHRHLLVGVVADAKLALHAQHFGGEVQAPGLVPLAAGDGDPHLQLGLDGAQSAPRQLF